MTFLEMFKKNNPKYVGDPEAVMMFLCPEDFGLEKRTEPCAAMAETISRDACVKCWNREARDTESAGDDKEADSGL